MHSITQTSNNSPLKIQQTPERLATVMPVGSCQPERPQGNFIWGVDFIEAGVYN